MARTLFDIYPAPAATSSADKNPLLAAAKKMKGSTSRGQYRVVKRCLYFVAFVSLLPVGVIYLVSSDQLYKLRNYSLYFNDTRPQAAVFERTLGMDGSLANTLSPKEFHDVDTRMQNRLNYLHQTCSQYGLDRPGNDSLHKPNAWEFLINRQYHVIWCNVFKAASTSWMYNFNLMAGYSPQFLRKSNQVPLSLARKRYPRPSVKDLQSAMADSTAFLIVRHPFERLVSAYKDKFQYAVPHSFHQKLGFKIINKYRTSGARKPLYPTFPEFVNFLLDEIKAKKELDMHWTPITNFCTPCQVKFNVVAKFETLADDQQYLIEKASLTRVISPQWKNSSKGKSTKDLSQAMFAELNTDQVKALHDFFKYDFALFEYSPDLYFELASNVTSTSRRMQLPLEPPHA